jgi:general secretion pathway protein J
MKAQRGFTLIEVLVAIAIAAILSVMAFTAMSEALNHRETIKARAARLAAVQTTMRSFVQDFSQIQPRPVREPIGQGYQPAVAGGVNGTPEVAFTRGGWSNPAGAERSTLQRVRYIAVDGVLYREHWLVLDSQLSPDPVRRTLLDGVVEFRVSFMDDSRTWQDSWPVGRSTVPAGNAASQERQLRGRPIAVRVTLTLEDFGTLTRVIEVAG